AEMSGPPPRRVSRGRPDRPNCQPVECDLVARGIEADGLACFEGGTLGKEQCEALKTGLADPVDLGVAGDDISEPGFERRFQGLVVTALRKGMRRCQQCRSEEPDDERGCD